MRSIPSQDSAPVIPSTSGVAALAMLQALEEVAGNEAFQRALGALSSEIHREIASLQALSWVPLSTLTIITDEVARCAGLEPETMLDTAMRRASEHMFKTVWRMFLRFTTDDALIKRTPVLYSRSRNIGELSARMVAPGHAELVLNKWPNISDRQLRTVGIGMSSVVALAGRRDVRVSSVRSADGGRFDLHWRADRQ
jgi:hypothetical protein